VILVVTGTQLPFPRLIGAMDALAPSLKEPVIAQVGPDTTPRMHIETHAKLPPAQFETLFREARVIVAHAGVGSILSAKRLGRPLIVVPRRFDLGEHRNDHQQATAKELEGITGVRIAWDLDMLPSPRRSLSPAHWPNR
jgi:UDP-N-acetylglucosamine transferase subunit ALG13